MIGSPPAAGAERVAAFAAALHEERPPDEVLATARLLLLDTVGCALAAATAGGYDGVRAVAVEQGGFPQARIIGSREMVPGASAALVNGTLAHALDFDDIHPTSSAHTSAVVVPAALAAAEASSAGGGELLDAIVLGTEVAARIGSIVPAGLHERGFHATSVAGVFGAAAAAAALNGVGPAVTTAALGIAGSTASGILAYLDDATETKPLHAGWAAHAGVLAVAVADAGVAGPPSVLEGRYGILDSFLRGTLPDPAARRDAAAAAFEDLGRGWRTLEVTPKAYPCCAFMHPWLAAVEGALGGERQRGEDLTAVRAALPSEVAARLAEPRARADAPASGYDAKFSFPYSLAALLLGGELNLASYGTEAIADPQVLELARRIEISTFAQDNWSTSPRGEVELRLSEGRMLTMALDGSRVADNALGAAAGTEAKFHANAAPALGADRARALGEAIAALDGEASISLLTALLAPCQEGAPDHTEAPGGTR
ncbi:MAG: MmgE/PrpD family protein [Solirubrobacterales bacterium]